MMTFTFPGVRPSALSLLRWAPSGAMRTIGVPFRVGPFSMVLSVSTGDTRIDNAELCAAVTEIVRRMKS